jgi:hypothetical protein
MKVTQIFLVVFISLFVLFVTGCKKDEDVVGTDVNKANERVYQGNHIMFPHMVLIVNSGGRDSAALNMASANSLFEEAITLDPNNTHARFGAALTGVVTVFSDPTLFSAIGNLSGENPVPPTPISQMFSFFNFQQDIRKYGRELQSRAESKLTSLVKQKLPPLHNRLFMPLDTPHPPSHYQDVVETKLVPALARAIFHLKQVTTNQQFAFYITPQMTGGNMPDSIRIDLTEIYLLLSVFQALHAEASAFVSYNVDYNPNDANAVSAAWQVSSPFLALRTNGVQRMRDVRTSYLGMASSIQSGILYLKNETTHPGIDLIRYRPEDDANLMQLYAGMDSLTMVLSGPYQVMGDFDDNGSNDVLTINLKNFFDNAITNYKAKLPGYTATSTPGSGNTYDAILTWEASSFGNCIFPDATFSGFLPNMTDALLKQTFGITAADWQQTVRLGD